MHPLSDSFSKLTDAELQDKLDDLNKKYWMANDNVRSQIVMMLDSIKLEQENRTLNQKNIENPDNTLDNLIKIS
tara:strand:+ start:473 stop:694 length:222 start_codon:yes stop_codon:yes gene_type:complete